MAATPAGSSSPGRGALLDIPARVRGPQGWYRDRVTQHGFVSSAPLSTDLDDLEAVPYFLWDEPMTVADLRGRLASASRPERLRLLAKVLREARDTDVWRFTSVDEVLSLWPLLSRHLGKRRFFWEFLINRWREQGLIRDSSPR